jgi:hypothetical protein
MDSRLGRRDDGDERKPGEYGRRDEVANPKHATLVSAIGEHH